MNGSQGRGPQYEQLVYPIRSGGLFLDDHPTLSLVLASIQVGSHSDQSDLPDFREREPRMRIHDLSVFYVNFIARTPTIVRSRRLWIGRARCTCPESRWRRPEINFNRARPASSTQSKHCDVGGNPFRPCCSKRFGQRAYICCSPPRMPTHNQHSMMTSRP